MLDNLFEIKHETLHVEIETNNYCNAKCIHCPRDKMPKPFMMKEKTFDNIIGKYSKYRKDISLNKIGNSKIWPKIIFSGGGEPILNPKIFDFIKKSRKNDFYTKLFSNGAMISKDKAEKLASTSINEISVSFLSIDKEEFIKTMGHDEFDKTIENILYLRDILKNTKIRFYLTYNALDTLKNTDEEIMNFWKKEKIECVGPYVVWNRGGLLDKFKQKRNSIDKNKNINFNQIVWCLRLQHYDTISSKGDFLTCCCAYFDKNTQKLGNINTDTLKKIHSFYERLLKEKNNKMCKKCIKPSEKWLLYEVVDFLENKEKFRL